MSADSERDGRWRDMAVIVALSACVFVPSLFTRDPWNPDEPRYTEVAREMVVTGNYAVPHLNGEIYPDKPAPFFWMVALLMQLGFGFASGRVVAAVASTGTLLLVCHLGRRLYGRQVGLLAALATLSTLLFAWIGKFGVLDPPLTFLVLAAIVCGVHAFGGEGRRSGAWWLGAYGAAGCGVLIKGPVAIIVPALVLLAYGVARRRDVCKGGWWHLAGVGLMLAVVAAGMAPSLIQGGAEYRDNILVDQTKRRFEKRASHAKPFYFFWVTWPAYFLPWALLVPIALASAIRAARSGREPQSWLPALWLLVVLVFFSIPEGKRERYILPVIPAVGLLVARYAVGVAEGDVPWPRWHRWMWRVTLILGIFVAISLGGSALTPGPFAERFEADAEALGQIRALLTPGRIAAALALSAALIAAVLYASATLGDLRQERRRVALAIAAALAVSLVGDLVAVPLLDHFKSGRDLVDRGKPMLDAADEVYLFRSDYSGVYNLFSGRVHMPVAKDAEALEAALAQGRRIAVIAREKHIEHLPSLPLHVAVRERVGSKKMVILTNWKPDPSGVDPNREGGPR